MMVRVRITLISMFDARCLRVKPPPAQDALLPLLAQLQHMHPGEGAPMLPGGHNPGDYVDDGRFDELLERLFQEQGTQMTPASEPVIERLQSEVTTMSASGVPGVCSASFSRLRQRAVLVVVAHGAAVVVAAVWWCVAVMNLVAVDMPRGHIPAPSFV